MLQQIETELQRVIGPTGVDVRIDTACQPPLARVETAEAVWGMEPKAFLELLKELPDRAGILALRQAVDSHPAKVSYDDCQTIQQETR